LINGINGCTSKAFFTSEEFKSEILRIAVDLQQEKKNGDKKPERNNLIPVHIL